MVYVSSFVYKFNITEFLKYYLLFGFAFIFGTAKVYFKWSHSYILFLLAFALFLLSRVFLDILGIADIDHANKWAHYYISTATKNKVLLIYIISLFSINFGTLQKFNNRTNIFKSKTPFKYPKTLNFLIVAIIIILIPGTFLKLLHDLQEIYHLGYESAYKMNRIPAHFIYRLSWFLLQSTIPLYLLIKPTKKQFIFFIFLTLFINFSVILSGNRSTLIVPLAFFFWYYYKFYSKKKIRILPVISIVLLIIIFSALSLNLREKQNVNKFNLQKFTYSFFYGQGVTYLTTVYYFDYNNKLLNPSRFALLNSINNFFIRSDVEISHNVEYVKRTLSLDHKITYAVNPEEYLAGKGLGTSFLIELFALGGWVAVVIGSYFLGVSIIYFEYLFSNNQNLLFFAPIWIGQIIQLPRAELLPDMVPLFLTIFILLFLKFIVLLIKRASINIGVKKLDQEIN